MIMFFFGFCAEANTKPDNDVAAAVAMSAAEVPGPNLDTPMPEAHAPSAPTTEHEDNRVSVFSLTVVRVCVR